MCDAALDGEAPVSAPEVPVGDPALESAEPAVDEGEGLAADSEALVLLRITDATAHTFRRPETTLFYYYFGDEHREAGDSIGGGYLLTRGGWHLGGRRSGSSFQSCDVLFAYEENGKMAERLM